MLLSCVFYDGEYSMLPVGPSLKSTTFDDFKLDADRIDFIPSSHLDLRRYRRLIVSDEIAQRESRVREYLQKHYSQVFDLLVEWFPEPLNAWRSIDAVHLQNVYSDVAGLRMPTDIWASDEDMRQGIKLLDVHYWDGLSDGVIPPTILLLMLKGPDLLMRLDKYGDPSCLPSRIPIHIASFPDDYGLHLIWDEAGVCLNHMLCQMYEPPESITTAVTVHDSALTIGAILSQYGDQCRYNTLRWLNDKFNTFARRAPHAELDKIRNDIVQHAHHCATIRRTQSSLSSRERGTEEQLQMPAIPEGLRAKGIETFKYEPWVDLLSFHEYELSSTFITFSPSIDPSCSKWVILRRLDTDFNHMDRKVVIAIASVKPEELFEWRKKQQQVVDTLGLIPLELDLRSADINRPTAMPSFFVYAYVC